MRNCSRSSPCAAAAFARPRSCSPSTLTTPVWSKLLIRFVCARCASFPPRLPSCFLSSMVYGLQHFSAIEGSYRVESEKQQLDQLREENRQLRLSEAQLSQPSRINGLAHQMGLAAPEPGQVVHATAHADNSAPVYAQFTPPPHPRNSNKLDGEYSLPRHAVNPTPRQPRAQRNNSYDADEPKTLLARLPLLSPLGSRHHHPSLLAATRTPFRLC